MSNVSVAWCGVFAALTRPGKVDTTRGEYALKVQKIVLIEKGFAEFLINAGAARLIVGSDTEADVWAPVGELHQHRDWFNRHRGQPFSFSGVPLWVTGFRDFTKEELMPPRQILVAKERPEPKPQFKFDETPH